MTDPTSFMHRDSMCESAVYERKCSCDSWDARHSIVMQKEFSLSSTKRLHISHKRCLQLGQGPHSAGPDFMPLYSQVLSVQLLTDAFLSFSFSHSVPLFFTSPFHNHSHIYQMHGPVIRHNFLLSLAWWSNARPKARSQTNLSACITILHFALQCCIKILQLN